MNQFVQSSRRYFVIACALGLLLPVHSAWSTLTITASEQVVNEYGQIIEGSAGFGLGTKPRVQVFRVGAGRMPPNDDGTHHAQNTLIYECAIGTGLSTISPDAERPGNFRTSITGAGVVTNNMRLFVRVLNAPLVEDALFYADSQELTVVQGEGMDWAILFANFTGVTNVISYTRDTDGDGIPDYYEHLNFGGATNAVADVDYDGDGTTALEEYIAGTDPFDDADVFMITSVKRVFDPNDYMDVVWEDTDEESPTFGQTLTNRMYGVAANILSWPSKENRLYKIEYSIDLVSQEFEDLPGAFDIPATPPQNWYTNSNLLDIDLPIFYRARVRIAP